MGETVFVVLGYLLGSISFSYIVSRRMAGIDIRDHGSKNAGATNTLRILGKGPAILVLLLDALKGSLSVFFVAQFTQSELMIMLTGVATIIGHNWPIFFGFKGGKGVATTIGVMFTLAFKPALIVAIICILFIYIFRYVSLGSLIFATLLPMAMYVFDYHLSYIFGGVIIMILSYIRHRTNIVRLLKGEENKLGKKQGS
jgi:glycerol-3-phosphate acyltransferase PlsY